MNPKHFCPRLSRYRILRFSLQLLAFSLPTAGSLAAQQAWVAKYNLGPQSTNQAVAVALGPDGNIIVAGHGTGAGSGYDYILIKYSPLGTQVWARTYASAGSFNNQVRAMKVDSDGNILLTGTSDTIMYAANGQLLWTRPYAGRALAVDQEHLYITGFSNSMFATAKLQKDGGSNIWIRTFTVMGGPDGPSQAIALDQNTNVFVAGANTCLNFPSFSAVNMFTFAYGADGNIVWGRQLATGCEFRIWDVKAVDADNAGNVYVMGNSFSAVYEMYSTAKFDSRGNVVWKYYLETQYYDGGRASLVYSDDFLYLIGASGASVNRQFGTVKLDANAGTNIWHRQYGGPGTHQANAIASDSRGNIYVTGQSAPPNSAYDFATVSYSPDGILRWATRFNGPANLHDEAAAIAVSPAGEVYVTGFSTTSSNLVEMTTIKYIQVAPIEKKSNGNILLTFCGAPGSNYVIQATTNFPNWSTIGTTTADSNGLYRFEDTNAPLYPNRFYKAQEP